LFKWRFLFSTILELHRESLLVEFGTEMHLGFEKKHPTYIPSERKPYHILAVGKPYPFIYHAIIGDPFIYKA